MDKMIIRGGVPLRGTVAVSGSKNTALPILIAALLTDEPVRVINVPRLRDVTTTLALLGELGADARWCGDNEVEVRASAIRTPVAPYNLVKTMRASFLVLGPLLAREGRAQVATPGGDTIGVRPVNLHVTGMRALGAKIQLKNGYVEARAKRLRGARLWLDNPSVGATENIMMAAVRARGHTQIENVAREPEIVDLAQMLCSMGAKISGAGTHVIEIDGVDRLHGCEHEVIPDRIEAGSLMVAAAISGGDVTIKNAPLKTSGGRRLEAHRVGRRRRRQQRRCARAPQRQIEPGRAAHASISRLPDRFAGADDGVADAGGGHLGHNRDHF